MVNPIGSFAGVPPIIPVVMRPNDIGQPPTGPVDDSTLRWGKASQFQTSAREQLPVDNSPGHGAKVHYTKIKNEVRIEAISNAAMWKTQSYDLVGSNYDLIGGAPPVPNDPEPYDTWTEAWIPFGTETRKEIIGSTAGAGGTVAIYGSREIEYILHLMFSKFPSTPRRSGPKTTHGALP